MPYSPVTIFIGQSLSRIHLFLCIYLFSVN